MQSHEHHEQPRYAGIPAHRLNSNAKGLMRLPSEIRTKVDLYELTMLRACSGLGMGETALFDLFLRELPPQAIMPRQERGFPAVLAA